MLTTAWQSVGFSHIPKVGIISDTTKFFEQKMNKLLFNFVCRKTLFFSMFMFWFSAYNRLSIFSERSKLLRVKLGKDGRFRKNNPPPPEDLPERKPTGRRRGTPVSQKPPDGEGGRGEIPSLRIYQNKNLSEYLRISQNQNISECIRIRISQNISIL